MALTGAVGVDHHQFLLTAAATDPTDITAESDLIWTGPGFIAVQAGIAYGPVTLTLDTTAESGVELADWDIVEETVIESAEELLVISLDGHVAEQFTPVPPGRYRIRVHARGRDLNHDLDVTEPSETYLIQLTPSSEPVGHIDIVHPRQSEAAAGKRIPELDYERVRVYNANGRVTTAEMDSPEAQAVFALRGTWGGRPPTGPIAADRDLRMTASSVADLDRDLVDEIAELSIDRQRALARWCARAAFDRAGLSRHADFRAALDALEHGTAPPADFDNASLIDHRLMTNPDIELTVVPGLPGYFDVIAQQQAAKTYAYAAGELEPLRTAFEAVRCAAFTFGPDYPELLDRVRTEFLSTPGAGGVQLRDQD